jgi:hypothetical protein
LTITERVDKLTQLGKIAQLEKNVPFRQKGHIWLGAERAGEVTAYSIVRFVPTDKVLLASIWPCQSQDRGFESRRDCLAKQLDDNLIKLSFLFQNTGLFYLSVNDVFSAFEQTV